MLLQRKAFARRIAQTKLQLRRRRNRAVGEIAARFGAMARGQRVGEEFCGEIHHVVERLAALLVTRGVRRHRRQRHAGHRSEALDGFREADAFGLHQERDDVAVLAGGEVVIKTLLVVDRERGRLLLLERRQPLELPPRLLQLDAPAHDFGDRKPGAQFVEELGREAHGVNVCLSCGCQPTGYRGELGKIRRLSTFSPLFTASLRHSRAMRSANLRAMRQHRTRNLSTIPGSRFDAPGMTERA